jgi:hypothetical protein
VKRPTKKEIQATINQLKEKNSGSADPFSRSKSESKNLAADKTGARPTKNGW